MRKRRGSLWVTGLDEMVLQFKAGDIVKPVIVNNLGFVGVVRDVDPKINKVMVAWGNGSMVQHDPDEVQLVSPQDYSVRAKMASRRSKLGKDFFVARESVEGADSQTKKATDISMEIESEEKQDASSAEQTRFVSPEMNELLNKQVGIEFFSAYLYFIAGAWFQSKGLVGFQAWMDRQGHDEIEHACKVFKYLVDTGSTVDLPAIPAPKVNFLSVADATRAILDHEMAVTRQWKLIGEVAKNEPNLATQELASWFMTEQVEEEDGAVTLHQKVQLADSGSGILMVDNDLKERDPNEVTASVKTAATKTFDELPDSEKAIAKKMAAKGYTYVAQITTNEGPFGEPLYFKSSAAVGPFLRSFPDYKNAKMEWVVQLPKELTASAGEARGGSRRGRM